VTSARIMFTPSGRGGSVQPGTSVLNAARALGVDLDSVCAGRGLCGRCQVVPTIGDFPKWRITARADALSAPAAIETDYRAARPLGAGARLGCAARIQGDVVIDVPPASQVHRPVIRKHLDLGPVDVDPFFTLHYVELADADSLATALRDQHALTVDAQAALAVETGPLTVACSRDGEHVEVVAQFPGYHDRAAGIAIDIGSTTIAGYLCDLATGDLLASAGRMNPQIRFGEDLMSRVSYVMMHEDGAAELTITVRRALDELIGELLDIAAFDREHVFEVVLVGNPIMHHLALGFDVRPLGVAPFTLATSDPLVGPAREVGLDLPHARFYAAPCIAGHVGADAAAAMLAEGTHRSEGFQLLVDIGTNAEIVLGNRTILFAASSPTGPAFEGAQISCGQRATAGAIERVRIDRTTLEPRFKVIGRDTWSDAGSRADHGSPAPRPTGVCGSGIVEVIVELLAAGVIDAQGAFVADVAARSSRVVADGRTFAYVLIDDADTQLRLTQQDVRAIQLAKAALRAGIELLHGHAGRPRIESIRIAGAFGSHLDPSYAIALGLIPDVPVERVRSVGNAAGVGAVLALLSQAQRAELERTVRDVVKIETATEPRFQEEFVAALAIPHASAVDGGGAGPRRRGRRATRPLGRRTR